MALRYAAPAFDRIATAVSLSAPRPDGCAGAAAGAAHVNNEQATSNMPIGR